MRAAALAVTGWLAGCCTLTGGRTQVLTLVAPPPDAAALKGDPHEAAAAGAGAVVLVEGALTPGDSVYASPHAGNGSFGAMDLYTNRNKTYLGYGATQIKLPRRTLGNHVTIYVYQPGFVTQRFELESKISGAYWANIFNIVGFFVDPFTGDLWSYGPETLKLSFRPLPPHQGPI